MAWWQRELSLQLAASSAKPAPMNDDGPAVDLTSESEENPSGAASASTAPEALVEVALNDTKVKREGAKRTASTVALSAFHATPAAASSDTAGEVQVTIRPFDEEIMRPAKRSRGPGGEEDVEMVGRNGEELPHNRFSCPENTFVATTESTHKEHCKVCFCYVCDRLASECTVWWDHCHALDSGIWKIAWANLRGRAKVLLQTGKSAPISCRYGPGPPAAKSPSRSPPTPIASPPSSSSRPSHSSYSDVVPDSRGLLCNSCNCRELCKPVAQVFGGVERIHVSSHNSYEPIVYLAGLTEEEVKHVEGTSVLATATEKAHEKFIEQNHAGGAFTSEFRRVRVAEMAKKEMPSVLKVPLDDGRFEMTIASKHMRTPPWAIRWRPGPPHAASVRLGGVTSIQFNIFTPSSSVNDRKFYFQRFVTETPLAPSVWKMFQGHMTENSHGIAKICGTDDHTLLNNMFLAHLRGLIAIEARAQYDGVTNRGAISIEVILMSKLLNGNKGLVSRTINSGGKAPPDFVLLVERLVLKKAPPSRSSTEEEGRPSSSSASSSSAPLASAAGRSASAGPANAGCGTVVGGAGRAFSPSTKGYGGRASLDCSLAGLIDSARAEEMNSRISDKKLFTPAKLLKELENLQHGALVKQPDCLTVQLFEHQLQDTQWMYDQEMLEGGVKQHLWVELPPHPSFPSNGSREFEFRRCWFSPILSQFTICNPFRSGIKGGILCDEMGLGKTAATLALHLAHPPKTPSEGVPLDEEEWGTISGRQTANLSCARTHSAVTEKPGSVVSKGTLVVCKLSLVGQWVAEAMRLCGGALTIYPYHGSNRNKDPNFLAKFDLVVTTYGIVKADTAGQNSGFPPLRRLRWWRVVLDESHTISKTTEAMRMVSQLVSKRRWCMTGTPYNLRFWDVNGHLKFLGLEGSFEDKDLGNQRPNHANQAQVVAFLRRVLLRHSQGMKLDGKNILGLPDITHKVEELQLVSAEREAYREFENAIQKDYVKVRYRLRHATGSHTVAVLSLLSKFRQACSGGQLLIHQPEEGNSTDASSNAFCPMCSERYESPVKTKCGHAFCQACITAAIAKDQRDEGPCPQCKNTVKLSDLVHVGGAPCYGGGSSSSSGGGASPGVNPELHAAGSGGSAGGGGGSASSPGTPGMLMETKLKALVKKLAAIRKKDPSSKSLVFSQFNSSLKWLQHALPRHGFQFRTLTGRMSRKQRTDALTAFSHDPPTTIFLLSVRSGEVGINLTQANNVFLLEPLLNLALEKQAVGRVHRLGQSRPVTVTKLVLKDSIETRILALQRKQATESGIYSSFSGVAGNIVKDTAKELRIDEYNYLFGVNNPPPEPARPSSPCFTLSRAQMRLATNQERNRVRMLKARRRMESRTEDDFY